MGQVKNQEKVLVRVHSECFTGDVLGSQRCDCGEQLHQALRRIAKEGQGVIIYLRQEGRGIGLEQKLKAYNLQDQGYDTVDANLLLGHQADEREYSAAAAILSDLGVHSIRLMTNNPAKIDQLEQLGLHIEERLALSSTVTEDNAAYLATKIQRMRHLLALPVHTNGHNHVRNHSAGDVNGAVASKLATLQNMALAHSNSLGRPFVTLSYAQTLDGTIGSNQSGNFHISGPESLVITHQLRARHDAIMIGIGTLLADDPQLTVRLAEGANPQPIIVDSQLRTPLDARIWSHPKPPWIATINGQLPAAQRLRERGARVIELPATPEGVVNLTALFSHLGGDGIHSVMVEGGAALIASLLQKQLAHYAVITVAPRFTPGIRVNTVSSPASGLLQAPEYLQAGADIVIWGEFDWRQSPPSSLQTALAMQNGFTPSQPSPHYLSSKI
jgi:3,4-dihydroxy 2-butanone 4-phosphate synthase/GTP cyclohydrolase II